MTEKTIEKTNKENCFTPNGFGFVKCKVCFKLLSDSVLGKRAHVRFSKEHKLRVLG